jgi:hypothetical protein
MGQFFKDHPHATSPLLRRKLPYPVDGHHKWEGSLLIDASSILPFKQGRVSTLSNNNYADLCPTSVPMHVLHLIYSAWTGQMGSAVFLPSKQPQMLGRVNLFWAHMYCFLVI